MTQHVVTMNGPKHYIGKNPEYHEVNISRAIIGMIAYMVFIAPIISLLSVSALEIGSAYIMIPKVTNHKCKLAKPKEYNFVLNKRGIK